MVRGRTQVVAIGVAVIAVMVTVATALVPGASAESDPVILTSNADRWPNHTARQWVTYADHVVVASAMRDEPVEPTQGEIELGEGLIMRTVTLRVDDVLWSRKDAPERPPKAFSWLAWGWQFTNGSTENRTPMASRNTPRVEPGHTYIIAIEWVPAQCDPIDGSTPAAWKGLGSDAIIPFDGQVLGKGEMEGTMQTLSEARARVERTDVDPSLEDKLVGKDATVLSRALKSANPGKTPALHEATCN